MWKQWLLFRGILLHDLLLYQLLRRWLALSLRLIGTLAMAGLASAVRALGSVGGVGRGLGEAKVFEEILYLATPFLATPFLFGGFLHGGGGGGGSVGCDGDVEVSGWRTVLAMMFVVGVGDCREHRLTSVRTVW